MIENKHVYGIRDVCCARCGKQFVPAPYHQYKDGAGNLYCTYHCYNSRETKNAWKKCRVVIMYDKQGNVLREFVSASEATDYLAGNGLLLRHNAVATSCKNGSKIAGKYFFKYKDDVRDE